MEEGVSGLGSGSEFGERESESSKEERESRREGEGVLSEPVRFTRAPVWFFNWAGSPRFRTGF